MVDIEPITGERIGELLRFLPLVAGPSTGFSAEWRGGERDQDGALTMPYPIYPPAVLEFFELAGQPCWSDYDYEPSAAGEMVRSDAAIATASLAQIKTMLTFCVRGERFCDGHWQAMIDEGRIAAILRSLEQLRDARDV